MLTQGKFLSIALVGITTLSGYAGEKANLPEPEKPARPQISPDSGLLQQPAPAESLQVKAVAKDTAQEKVAKDTVQEKKRMMERKGIKFREAWVKLTPGMSVEELTRLFDSDLGLGFCNGRPGFCSRTPNLNYFGFPAFKSPVTFTFNAGKLTEWTPKDLPPKE